MTPSFRYHLTYDYPAPGVLRTEFRVTGGTPEENEAEAARVTARLADACRLADMEPRIYGVCATCPKEPAP